MGTPAMAILGFGIDLGERLPQAFSDKGMLDGWFEFDELVCRAEGIVEPEERRTPAYEAYQAARRQALKDCPATFCVYGVEDRPRYMLFVNGSVISATPHGPERVVVGTVGIALVQAFAEFCAKYGVAGSPSWQMVARYC